MAPGDEPKNNRAPRNRTLDVQEAEVSELRSKIQFFDRSIAPSFTDCVICGDAFKVIPELHEASFDVLFADPPYNLTKDFGSEKFRKTSLDSYEEWLDSWLAGCSKLLKTTASIYICGDWRSSSAIQRVGMKYFKLRNRITWEREKGRGSKTNWKNASEDIWFFTVSDEYTFNVDTVQLKRKVIAPYTENGAPKDWVRSDQGNFRLTHPSNLWTDLTVPFWSMPENTDHPTQKPEKLLAKIVLASSNENDLILDPFLGSGTTAVVAKKLNRRYVGIEADEKYCLLAQKRLSLAEKDKTIQGYSDGVFWERNTLSAQNSHAQVSKPTNPVSQPSLL